MSAETFKETVAFYTGCTRGLEGGGMMDYDCPNIGAHAKRAWTLNKPGYHLGVDRLELTSLHWTGSKEENKNKCDIGVLPGKFGSNSQLLEIVLNGSYVFAGEGVVGGIWHKLRHQTQCL